MGDLHNEQRTHQVIGSARFSESADRPLSVTASNAHAVVPDDHVAPSSPEPSPLPTHVGRPRQAAGAVLTRQVRVASETRRADDRPRRALRLTSAGSASTALTIPRRPASWWAERVGSGIRSWWKGRTGRPTLDESGCGRHSPPVPLADRTMASALARRRDETGTRRCSSGPRFVSRLGRPSHSPRFQHRSVAGVEIDHVQQRLTLTEAARILGQDRRASLPVVRRRPRGVGGDQHVRHLPQR